MGVQCYTLLLNADNTLCIEILNTDYQLWHKAKVSVHRAASQGLTIGNVSVRKFSHSYLDSKENPEFMYYYRLIINLKKQHQVIRIFSIFLSIFHKLELIWEFTQICVSHRL